MNRAAPTEPPERGLELRGWRRLYGEEGGARELVTTEGEGLCGDPTSLLWGKRKHRAVLRATSPFCGGRSGPPGQRVSFLLEQIIPDWLVTMMFLGEVETTIRSFLSLQ